MKSMEESKQANFSLSNNVGFIMKHLVLIYSILTLVSIDIMAQNYPKKTIMDIMNVPADSLAAGSLNSPSVGDTVIVRGVVSIPPVVNFPDDVRKIMIAGNRNYAIYLQDQNGLEFAGMPILCDTANVASNFVRLKKGQLIEVPIRVTAFPNNNKLGTTQGEVLSNGIVEFIDDEIALPTPPAVTIANFNAGKVTAATYNVASGAKYVGMKVEFSNLIVSSSVKGTNQRSTIILSDADGNEIYLRDQSNHYRTDAVQLGSYTAPTEGTKIKKIRGYISTNSIAGQPVPFMVSPGMPEDLELDMGSAPPIITSIRSTRTKAFPSSDETVPVAIGVKQGALPILSVKTYFSFNGNALDSVAAQKVNDTLWTATIPTFAGIQNGTALAKWFVRVNDESGLTLKSPLGDTTGYYYRILERAPKIADIREKLQSNGGSVYEGYSISITGTVTASASDIPNEAVNAPRVYVQDAITPYSGLFVRTTSPSSIVRAFPRGAKVKVTGIIRENFGVTSIDSVNAQETQLISTEGDPIQPVIVSTTDFARKSQGTSSAEQWESMLVKFQNVIVTDTNADGTSNFGEFNVVDASLYNSATESLSKMRVETDDGATTYGSTSATGKTVMSRGTGIKNLTGIMFFSFGNYKLVPRTNADIELGSVSVENDMTESSFDITPHPVHTTALIRCEVSSTKQAMFKIMNLAGQEVYSTQAINEYGNVHSAMIPAGLSAGIYIFKMLGDMEVQSGTFIVQP